MNVRVARLIRHPVALNALALASVQVGITLLPLVALPYLARVLGPSGLGVVVLVQSFSFLLGLVLEYGFGYSAAREVAVRRDDPAGLAETVADVSGAKLLLTGACVVLSLLAWPVVPAFRDSPGLLALGLALTLAQGLYPIWFYTGLERLRLAAGVEIASRAAGVVGVVLLVDDPGEAWLVLTIYAAATAAGTLGLHVVMYRQVPLRAPTLGGALSALRRGWALFVSNAGVTVYTSANVVLLGLFVPSAQVAFFAAAEKLIRAATRVLTAAGGAVYPRVAFLAGSGREDRANRLGLIALAAMTAVGVLAGGALLVFATPVVTLVYGPGFASAVPLLRILALTLPLGIVAATLATLWLLPHVLDRDVTRIALLAGAVDVVLVLLGTPLIGVEAAALSLVAVELFMVGATAYMVRRAGVFSLRRPPPVAQVLIERAEPIG